ncbi:glycosyltransferase family 2 protein [Pseudaestuariivita rosea]|uniref:glycosyltransferase family 2 protein n=1 Tax=Pseudaestuariivita rosea TaxID=2763263 RepID=UPI001ABB2814|nr:glycosyltransferase family 2 protein [Pseudaestuariivita rosea]
MKFSCIMTTFNDGALIRQSIHSILNQTHADFELLVIDDGSSNDTKTILADFDDPRIQVIPQANDGLSSARNRGLHLARGDYICFIDADDTRAPWSFADAARTIDETGADLILVNGAMIQQRAQIQPFMDQPTYQGVMREKHGSGDMPLAALKAWAAAYEPQSANKFISRDIIQRGQLRFPNDHFFEDILFHNMAIAHANRIEFLQSDSFTYFQRQYRNQLTGSNGQIRFDIIGTAGVLFQLFEAHRDFHNAGQRGALTLGALRLLRWCEGQISHYHRDAYRTALREMLRSIHSLFFVIDKSTPDPRGDRDDLSAYVKQVLA